MEDQCEQPSPGGMPGPGEWKPTVEELKKLLERQRRELLIHAIGPCAERLLTLEAKATRVTEQTAREAVKIAKILYCYDELTKGE